MPPSSLPDFSIQLGDIQAAAGRIRPYLAVTPLYEAASLSAYTGSPVFAKLECMHPTGVFKVRGAFNSLLQIPPAQRRDGVITASGGSHGLGVSYAAATLGIPADVFLAHDTSPAKVNKIRRLKAHVHLAGENYHEAHRAALVFAALTGKPYIHAYADPAVMAGQGTIGLEILTQLPAVSTVVVPVGGGGLISGISIAIKSQRPDVRIVAVQPVACPALSRSLAEGVWYETYDFSPTIADGLAGGIGREVIALAQAGWIDNVIDVPEAAILQGLAWMLREEQWLIEGAAALSVAALLREDTWAHISATGSICCVLTGANITVERLLSTLTSVSSQEISN